MRQKLLVEWIIRIDTFNSTSEQDSIRVHKMSQVDEKILGGENRTTEREIRDDISINERDQSHLETPKERLQIPGVDPAIVGGNGGRGRESHEGQAERLCLGKDDLIQAAGAVPDLLKTQAFSQVVNTLAGTVLGGGMMPKGA